MLTEDSVRKFLENETLHKVSMLPDLVLHLQRKIIMHGKTNFIDENIDQTSSAYAPLLKLSQLKKPGDEFNFHALYAKRIEESQANIDLVTLQELVDEDAFSSAAINSDGHLELTWRVNGANYLLYRDTPQSEFVFSKIGRLEAGEKYFF